MRKSSGTRRKNLEGKRFSRLLVTNICEIRKPHSIYWLCECDCGNKKWVRASCLTSGNIKSCGCLRKETDESRTEEGITAKKTVYSDYKSRCENDGLTFDFDFDCFISTCLKLCFYCGRKPSNIEKTSCRKNIPFVYSGLDRVDNNKGYSADNCVPCCLGCNRMKSNLSLDDFFDHLKKIASHHSVQNTS